MNFILEDLKFKCRPKGTNVHRIDATLFLYFSFVCCHHIVRCGTYNGTRLLRSSADNCQNAITVRQKWF
jgi:hypothetical protein